jgi:GntR family transcriptional repressor for pyruvate dehydrogenase complex
MREVTEARAAIEIHVGPLAAERGSDEDWSRLQGHLDGFADAVERREWRRAHGEHLAFHLALLHAIHLPALEILLNPMHEIIVLSSVPPTDNPELWDVPAHPPILAALRERDAGRARAALEEHFQRFLGDERYAEFEARPFREAGMQAVQRLAGGADGGS